MLPFLLPKEVARREFLPQDPINTTEVLVMAKGKNKEKSLLQIF